MAWITRGVLVASLLALAACDAPSAPSPTESQTPQAQSPASAAPIPPPRPPGPFTLTGTVFEATQTGIRPLAGVPLEVSEEFLQREPRTTSDRNGRYDVTVETNPDFVRVNSVKVVAEKDGYSQPCRSSSADATDGVLDIYVVSNALLAKSGIPSSLPIVGPTLTGRVFDPDGKALPGARVYIDFSGGFGIAASAATVTDADGRYLLCNVRDVGYGLNVAAHKYPLYSDQIPVPTPLPASLDINVTPDP